MHVPVHIFPAICWFKIFHVGRKHGPQPKTAQSQQSKVSNAKHFQEVKAANHWSQMAEPRNPQLISDGLHSSRSTRVETCRLLCACVWLAAKGSLDVPSLDATNQKLHWYAAAPASCIMFWMQRFSAGMWQ